VPLVEINAPVRVECLASEDRNQHLVQQQFEIREVERDFENVILDHKNKKRNMALSKIVEKVQEDLSGQAVHFDPTDEAVEENIQHQQGLIKRNRLLNEIANNQISDDKLNPNLGQVKIDEGEFSDVDQNQKAQEKVKIVVNNDGEIELVADEAFVSEKEMEKIAAEIESNQLSRVPIAQAESTDLALPEEVDEGIEHQNNAAGATNESSGGCSLRTN
jgi:hypothetical protein